MYNRDMKKLLVIISLLLTLFISPNQIQAQNQRGEQFEGLIENIEQTSTTDIQNTSKINVRIMQGRLENQLVEIHNIEGSQPRPFAVGDNVIVGVNKGIDGSESYYISDFVRRTPIFLLFILFVILVLFITRKKGLASLFGMFLSFLIMFYFLLPQILAGRNPVVITILSAMVIIPGTFYFSHGINRKTTAAVIGTFICLIITILLAVFFVEATKLSGFSSEEASFVKLMKGDINIKGLLLSGLIIGLLGVLDDITVAQSSVVFQLKQTQEKLTAGQLYIKAMLVGKDHIASMVNTLILVYTGASLPLLMLFINNSAPFTEVINYEIVAEEIVRTLVSSIGLILAVPITTYIAVMMASKHQITPPRLAQKPQP
jgi:uncharacterized membrane protein